MYKTVNSGGYLGVGFVVATTLILLLTPAVPAVAYDIIPTKDFQDGYQDFTTGWSRVSSSSDPTSCNPSGLNYYLRTSATGDTTRLLGFNTKGYYNLTLSFDSRCTGMAFRVEVRQNGTWVQQGRSLTGTNWGTRTRNLDATKVNDGLRFIGENGGSTRYARIDCVRLVGDRDTIPPNDFTPTANPPGWTTGNVSVSFATTDNETAIDYYEVIIDSTSQGPQTSPYTMQLEGVHTVHVKAYDWGDGTRTKSVTTYIDRTAPGQPGTPGGTGGCATATFTWAAASDGSGSGVADYYYQIDDDPNFGSPNAAGWTGGPGNRSATINSAGTWYCRVQAKDNVGLTGGWSATSSAVTAQAPPNTNLTVTALTSPVCPGSSSTIRVAGSESGVTYGLYIKGGSQVGSDQTGNGGNLDFSTGTLSSTTQFTVKATRSPCAQVSLSSEPTVTMAADTVVTVDPEDQNVVEGGTASFTASGTGEGTPGYQWQKLINSTWEDIDGKTDATLEMTNVSEADEGQYRCVISAGCGAVETAVADLTIAPQILYWESVKTHGSVGEIALAMPATPPLVEPRRGDLLIRVVFDREVQAADGTLDADDLTVKDSDENGYTPKALAFNNGGQGDVLDIVVDGDQVDQKRLTLELLDGKFRRPTSAKAVLAGARDRQVRCLVGDATGNGMVDILDLSAVRAQLFKDVDTSNARCDLNNSGSITIVDMALVKSRLFTTVP